MREYDALVRCINNVELKNLALSIVQRLDTMKKLIEENGYSGTKKEVTAFLFLESTLADILELINHTDTLMSVLDELEQSFKKESIKVDDFK